jgi:hypothetical protein
MRPVETLEVRRLLASFTASSVTELIADINAANAAGGSNTITLTPGALFKLSAVDNTTAGATGLPVVAAGSDLTIVGSGDTVERSTAKGTPAFRLFDVAAGGSLTLDNLTLSGGLAQGSSGMGGAIASLGTLALNRVTVQNCVAQGTSVNGPAFGGGIFSGGASAVLTVTDSTIRNNLALGAPGFALTSSYSVSVGGAAYGGGVYVYGSNASFSNVTFDLNVARGGTGADGYKAYFFKQSVWIPGGPGGNAYGGGVYATAPLELRATTVTRNAATGGAGGSSPKGYDKGADGVGRGGGIYIAPTASVAIDAVTQAHTTSNAASTSDNDIFGSFTLIV